MGGIPYPKAWYSQNTRWRFPARGFYNVLAHETAHALCTETHPHAEFHGVEFAVAALVIRDLWAGWGVYVDNVYDPEYDD